MAQWAGAPEEQRPFAWVALDSADNDAMRFWTYVVEALWGVAPELGETALDLLRARGLHFSVAEADGLFNDLLGLDVAADDVAALCERTEGWAAGLYLAALSLRGRDSAHDFLAAFAGDDRFVVDYLAEEVLAGLDDDMREFLLKTSILERLSAPLCDTVLGRSNSATRMLDVEQANLLLVPLDERREWYRYHHLFGDL